MCVRAPSRAAPSTIATHTLLQPPAPHTPCPTPSHTQHPAPSSPPTEALSPLIISADTHPREGLSFSPPSNEETNQDRLSTEQESDPGGGGFSSPWHSPAQYLDCPLHPAAQATETRRCGQELPPRLLHSCPPSGRPVDGSCSPPGTWTAGLSHGCRQRLSGISQVPPQGHPPCLQAVLWLRRGKLPHATESGAAEACAGCSGWTWAWLLGCWNAALSLEAGRPARGQRAGIARLKLFAFEGASAPARVSL